MDCPHIPEVNYGEFSKRIQERVRAKRIPLGGGIELTFRCNLRCAHCYIDHSDLQKELSYTEICSILDQICEEGCLWLLLTGGEPLLRKDFLDIYTYAKKKGLLITLFTNGTLISPEIADYLKEWRPFLVEITLYGITAETYERVTGIPGSLKQCLNGIELLVEKGIPLKLKSMILTLNKHELAAMQKYADDLGVEFRYDALLNPMLNGSKRPFKVAISPEEVVELDIKDEKRFKNWQEFCQKFWGAPANSEYLYTCGAGILTFFINPYGEMGLCVLSRQPNYNLRNGSFAEGWYKVFPQIRAQKRQKNYPCAHCDKIALCGQCPGWAELEHGDQERPVEYLCRIAHLRAEAFGLKGDQKMRKVE
jgi:radical SAM protein with 4Fe4S-binding SPASM domain